MERSRKIVYILIQAFIWIVIYLVSRFFLSSHYFFGWISHNWEFYFTLMLIAMIINLLRRNIGWAMSLGNVAGVFIAQFLGNYLVGRNTSQITPDMDEEMRYMLSTHHHVFIWVSCIIFAVVLTILIMALSNALNRRCKVH